MSNKSTIANYLREKGLSDKAIAGVMGNVKQESNYSTTATNSGSGAYGIFQWLGSRKSDLEKFAYQNDRDVSDIETQLDFFWHELNTTHKQTKEELFSNYETASDYAVAFEKSFERSGGSAITQRTNYAEMIHAELASGMLFNDGSSGVKYSSPISNKYGLKWWGDLVKVIVILLLIVGGVALFGVSFVSVTES